MTIASVPNVNDHSDVRIKGWQERNHLKRSHSTPSSVRSFGVEDVVIIAGTRGTTPCSSALTDSRAAIAEPGGPRRQTSVSVLAVTFDSPSIPSDGMTG